MANIERLLTQRTNSEAVKNLSPEISEYINSICNDNKNCEKNFLKAIIELDKSNSLSFDNIKKIPYKGQDSHVNNVNNVSNVNNEFKLFLNKVKNELKSNKIPNFNSWVISHLPNVLIEDYNEFFIDLKAFVSLYNDGKISTDITTIKNPQELRVIITPYLQSKTMDLNNFSNEEWKGEWIYDKNDISIFKSYDPITISNISNKYQTRWCIKDPKVAKDEYNCKNNPMFFVFIDNKVVCVIHKETNQIKDVHDTALNNITIIKNIDPIIKELNLFTYSGDFITYESILEKWKNISAEINKLSPNEKINYCKELISQDIDNIVVIDKNFIIYNKEIQDAVIEKLNSTLSSYGSSIFSGINKVILPTLPQELYNSVPEIKKIYINYWEEVTKDNVFLYVNSCPSYICKENIIQEAFVLGIEKAMKISPLNYIAFKGSYPEVINKNIDKFSKYIPECVEAMKERIQRNTYDYKTFTESKEKIPEIFENESYKKELDLTVVDQISKSVYDFQNLQKQYPEIFTNYHDEIEEKSFETIKEEIIRDVKNFNILNKLHVPIFKKHRPELEQSLLKGINKNINKDPSAFIKLNEEYPWFFKREIKTIEETLVLSLKTMIKFNTSEFALLMEKANSSTGIFSDIIKRHKLELEDEVLTLVEEKCNKDAINYAEMFFIFPEIIKKYELIFNDYIPECVEKMELNISKYSSDYEMYKKAVPHIFNNPKYKDKLLDSFAEGLSNDLSTFPLRFSEYSKKYPEIFKNEKYKLNIANGFVEGVKKGLQKQPIDYRKFMLQSLEIFSTHSDEIENTLIESMERHCKNFPINYYTFKKDPYINRIINKNQDRFNKFIKDCVTSMGKNIRMDKEFYLLYTQYKNWFPEIFNNPAYVKELEISALNSLLGYRKSDEDYLYKKYQDIFDKYRNELNYKGPLKTSNNWYSLFKHDKKRF